MIGTIASLDIGSTKVTCLIADVYRDGRTSVVGVGREACRGLKRGCVVGMDETVHAIERAVRDAEQASGRKVESVITAITGEHVSIERGEGKLTLTASGREITADDVRRVVENSRAVTLAPDQEVIDVIPRSFKVDGRESTANPVGIFGNRLEVATSVVVGGATCIHNLMRAIERAGLGVTDVVFQPLASASAALDDSELDVGVALIDIGGETCDVAVFEGGVLQYSGLVPIGAQHITRDVSKLLRTPVEEAERLKVDQGTTDFNGVSEDEAVEVKQLGQPTPRRLRRRLLAEIIQSRMWELLVMARQHIERSGRLALLPGGVVLTGGGSKLTGAADLAIEVLNKLPVRVGAPRGLEGMQDSAADPCDATAVGLIVFGARSLRAEELGEQRGDWLKTIRRRLFARDK